MATKQLATVRMAEQRWNKSCLLSLNDKLNAENTQMTQQILLNLGSALVGGFIGHWLSIGRDKRKEFNTVAERVYLALEKERHEKSPTVKGPSREDFLCLRRCLPFWSRRSFDCSLSNYELSKGERKQFVTKPDDPIYHDPEILVAAINDLLAYTRRK
jgi:hypothetical protein